MKSGATERVVELTDYRVANSPLRGVAPEAQGTPSRNFSGGMHTFSLSSAYTQAYTWPTLGPPRFEVWG